MEYNLELGVTLNDEQKAMFETAKRFAAEVLRPAGIELDKLATGDVIKKDAILRDVYKKFCELGFHRLAIPKELGGIEVDPLLLSLIVELWGYGDAGIGVSFLCSIATFILVAVFGGPEAHKLVREYCDDTEGRIIGCFAATEPDHGSDWVLAGQQGFADPKFTPSVKAVRQGTEYIISGQKSAFISNGPIATHAIVFLNLDPAKGMQGTGMAFLPLDLPGISRGEPFDKLGLRSYPQGAIIFDEVRIPESMMFIPDPEAGFKTEQWWFLNMCGGLLSSINVGLAQAAFDEALKYAKVRIQGGKPIFEHQNIQLKLIRMFTMIESAKAYARKIAFCNPSDPSTALYAVASKVCCSETAFNVASEAIQIMGGYGLSKEYPVEKMFRDARVGMIGEENNALSLAVANIL